MAKKAKKKKADSAVADRLKMTAEIVEVLERHNAAEPMRPEQARAVLASALSLFTGCGIKIEFY